MKVGITGASGFLGSAIMAEGKSRGWTVVAFSRGERIVDGADETRSLADPGSIDLDELDALIHLAGEPIAGLWTRDKKRRIHESRVDLTLDLVEAMNRITRTRRPAVFVSASAIGYYGDRADDWLDEESDVGFGFLPAVCRDWESASAGAEKLGVRVVNPRIGLVMGREGFLKRLRTLFKLGLGGRLGRGNQWMSWIHVQDLARIFAECVENGSIHGRVNCASPHPATNREFTTVYARLLVRPAIFTVPAFLLKRLPGGMSSLFLDSQRVEPVVMQSFDFAWSFPDLESALRDVESKS
jgi:uncharacterized protein (TIGR01777 family)